MIGVSVINAIGFGFAAVSAFLALLTVAVQPSGPTRTQAAGTALLFAVGSAAILALSLAYA